MASLVTKKMQFYVNKKGTWRKISNSGQDGSVGLTRTLKPTFISPTNEIHLKSLLKRDGIKKKNEYELDEERMREKSAEGDRYSPLILMKQPFMRIERHRKFSRWAGEAEINLFRIETD